MSLAILVLICVVPAAAASWCITAAMRRIAPRIGLIDQPAARKVHVTPTPLGGGLGIFGGFVVTVLAAQCAALWLQAQGSPPDWLPTGWSEHVQGLSSRAPLVWMILAAGALLVVMGLLDDARGLRWQSRLAVQFLLAAGLAAGGIRATLFVEHAWIGYVFTILWIVVLINAFNFLDNMDALSGGIGLIAAALFAAVMLTSRSEPRWLVGGALLVLAGSIAGFLIHNWPPAKIFMGDAGSTFLGLMLACLTIAGTFYEPDDAGPHVMFAPLCVLAVPLYDFGTVLVIRLAQGKSPFHPDKNHFSHRLVRLGLTKTQAVLTVHLATLTTGLGALLLYRVDGMAGAAMILLLIVCLLAIIAILETAGRRGDV